MEENENIYPNRPVCGARNRRGGLCGNWPMINGRCRYHGGKSTGPKTEEGIARIKAARTTHGAFTYEAKLARALFRQLQVEAKRISIQINQPSPPGAST